MALHSLLRAVGGELHRRELPSTVRSQHPQSPPRLCLNLRLELLDGFCCFALAGQEPQPHVATVVIHQQEEIPPPSMRGRGDRPA